MHKFLMGPFVYCNKQYKISQLQTCFRCQINASSWMASGLDLSCPPPSMLYASHHWVTFILGQDPAHLQLCFPLHVRSQCEVYLLLQGVPRFQSRMARMASL